MNPLSLFIINGLIHASFFVYAETTFVEDAVNGEEDVVQQSPQCTTLENEFQKYVINTMDGSLGGFTQSYDCLTREVVSKTPGCVKLNGGKRPWNVGKKVILPGALSAKIAIKKIRGLVRSAGDKGIDSKDHVVLGKQNKEISEAQRGVISKVKRRFSTDPIPDTVRSITKRKFVEAHKREVEQLDKMGVSYREMGNMDGYLTAKIKGGSVKATGFNPEDLPVRSILKVEGVTGGKKHNRSLGPAFSHRDMEARIREANARGVDVVVDASLSETNLILQIFLYKNQNVC